jgi:penicillin-binding protein 1A
MESKFKASLLSRMRRAQQQKMSQGKWKKLGLIFGGILLLVFLFRVWIVLTILQIGQFIFTPILPDIDNVDALFASQSTIIYDREGSELYTIHGDENRFEIPFEKIPETVKLATIAAEDDNFYNHHGFDVDGIARAVLGELGIGDFIGGGSTITQQFVKNAYLSPEKTYWRKLQELMLSLKFENRFTKDEILEMYLNRIPYGGNAYGIQAAAQTFFNKNSEDLSLAEAAVLAALPQRPSKYSPYGQNPDFLMGSCGKVAESEIVENVENLKVKIRATGEVWLKISIDGEVKKEGILKKDEFYESKFDDDFNIISGNQNFQVLVNDEEVFTKNESNFTATKTDFAKIETIVAAACDSIKDPDYETGRKDYVLQRMLDLGFITKSEFATAWQESNNLQFTAYREAIKAPHFVFFVRDILEEKFDKDIVERGGLRVFTTLDSNLQAKAEELIAAQFPQSEDSEGNVVWGHNRFDATNASLLAVDNETGQILTMVGSRDYFEALREDGYGNDGATNLTTRPRQPGSSFKPIAYTAGLEQGYTPASVFWDVETNFGKNTDEYTPQNYDGTFLGPLSMRRSIGHSRNIPAVKMAILAGELKVVETARQLGISSIFSDERYGPTVALGAAEIPMIEMVKAYSVFSNGGEAVEFNPILKITDSRGNIIEEFEKIEKKFVLDSAIAYLMTNILSDSNSRPAGWNHFLNLTDRPNGAKTGTANKKISEEKILPGDVWTIGFTSQITAAAWMGNNDGSPMNTSGTGLASASPIWKGFMDFAHKNLPVKNFKVPEGIVQRSVSQLTGKLASATTPVNQIVVETFIDSTVPLEVDDAFVEITVDAASDKLPTELTPESALVKKKFINLHSERDYDPEWEKPVRTWLENNFAKNGDTLLQPPPTEFDTVHTADSAKEKPSITIVSPISNSTIQKSSIGIWVDVSAPHGVEKVEFYRDGDLVATALTPPWKGVIPIPLKFKNGDKVNLTAKIFDKLYYADSSSVEVTIGDDTQIPTAKITAPTANSEISRGSTFLVKADAYDAGGDIKKVSFSLDGSQFSEISAAPYEALLTISSSISLGNHALKITATDTSGFVASDSVTFRVVEGGGNIDDFAIIFPENASQVPIEKLKIEVVAQINRTKFVPQKIDFIARNLATNEKITFASLDDPSGETFSVEWEGFTIGEYELYFKARDAEGKTIISGRNSIEIK